MPQSGLYVGSNPIQYIPPSTKVAHEVLSSKKSIAGFRTPARSCVSRAAGTKAGVSPMQRAIFSPPTPNAGFEPESRIVRPPHVVTIGLRARTVRGFESHPIHTRCRGVAAHVDNGGCFSAVDGLAVGEGQLHTSMKGVAIGPGELVVARAKIRSLEPCAYMQNTPFAALQLGWEAAGLQKFR